MTTFEKVILWTIKIGLLAITFLPLYISTNMLFPFITGKNFFFRIIVEFIFALWVGLAIARPEFRPKLTSLFKAVTIFILVLFLADLFSPNPYRSFFSNYERMEGFMMLFHLYLYFLLLVSVLKERKDWLLFLHFTIGVSLVVGFVGLMQKLGLRVSFQGGYRVDSTIGNPAYLAAYLVFHAWFLVMLARAFWQKIWLRMFYLAALVFELLIIYFTATRGALLALFFGAVMLLVMSIVYWQKLFPLAVGYRKFAVGVLGVLIVLPVLFWQVRNATWLPTNSAFSRLASISLQDRTTQSRFSIWQMSFKGAMERPILGWGQENYYLVFQKYFDPKLYASEPWFDRSHNIVFDWLIHAGFLGLLSFFSIIVLAMTGLIRGIRSAGVFMWESTLLLIIFSTYLFQNIFVFDNLNTYLLFFASLAYAEFLIPRARGESVVKELATHVISRPPAFAYAISGGFLLLVIFFGYSLHLQPMRASNALIRGLMLQQAKAPPAQMQAAFQEAIAYNTFGTTEAREQLANVARSIIGNTQYSEEERKQFVTFAVEELKKELVRPAKDVKHLIFLASVLDRAVSFDPNYILEAENLVKEAIAISPRKQILYFELGQIYMIQGKTDQALEALTSAFELESSYPQAAVNLALVAQATKHPEIIEKVKSHINVEALDEDGLTRIGTVYQQTQDFVFAKNVFARLIQVAPGNPRYQAVAAALFATVGEFDNAMKAADAAAKLDAAYASDAALFIQQIKDQLNAR